MRLGFAKHSVSRLALILAFVWAAAALGLLILGCGGDHRASRAPMVLGPEFDRGGDLAWAIAIQETEGAYLLDLPGVVGAGVGRDASGNPVIMALLERADGSAVPERLGGLRVVTEVIGPVEAFALTDRYRPVPIGVSAGNTNECLPGTIGCVLAAGDQRFLLSANHVFARQNQAVIGERIIQPSLTDVDPACGPPPATVMVARLSDFEPVVYDGRTPNVMDAAIAELTTNDFTCATLAAFYGAPSTVPAQPVAGAAVLKVGRTTELTRGTIKAINVKVKVTFPSGTALFVGQILTSKAMGAFGDSGALLVTDDGEHHPLGIVIGGGSTGAAIVSPIGPILDRFGATVCGD